MTKHLFWILLPLLAAAGCASTPKSGNYSGLGSESVSPATIQKFAPPALPSAVSRKIQSYLDVRSPGMGMVTPDGKKLFFGWNITGFNQVWRLESPRGFPVQVTGGEDNTSIVAITPDGKYVVLQRDRNGEENPGLYLQPTAGGALVTIQHQPKVQTGFQFVTDDSRYVYFRANDIKPDSYAIYRYEIATGKKEPVFTQDGIWYVADHSPDASHGTHRLLLGKETGSLWAEFSEWNADTGKLTPLFGQGEKEEYYASYGAHDGEILVITPKFGEFRRLYRWKNGKFDPITPEVKKDVSEFRIDRARTRVLIGYNDQGYSKVEAIDARSFKPIALPKLPPADNVTPGFSTPNGRYTTIGIDDGRNPRTSYVLDWKTRKLIQWVVPSAPEMDTSRFARAELGRYPARDGTPIPYFVRIPERCAKPAPGDAPCPVIVNFHGGPEGQTQPGFNPMAQAFVDDGFIFMQPNVRGSDGYGKTWIQSDDGPKRLNVITDIQDAARFARQKWAQGGKAPRVGIFGGSYGGYSSLVGMTMFAGTYDAGVAVVGMSNLVTFLMNTAPYRRILRISEYGDPIKDREALDKLSPIHYIGRVKDPLLLIQGANDPRVPVGEAIQIHDALEKNGVAAPLIVFADEGHGSAKRSNKVLELGHTLRFFEEHLKDEKH